MKILTLSDLNWHQNSRKINRDDLFMLYEATKIGHGDRFRTIRKYWKIIDSEEPEIVLIAGDVTGDGSCGHGFHSAFYYLLCLLELRNIVTCFIQGDNDLVDYYTSVTDNLSQFNYIKEISNKELTIKGLRILGIPYDSTAQKRVLKQTLLDNKDKNYDIILCHCPLKRRTFLLNMNSKYLLTGHFDNKILPLQNKIFISCSNDSEVINYATINFRRGKEIIHYKFINPSSRMLIDYKLIKLKKEKSYSFEDGLEVNGIPVPIKEYENMSLPRSSYEKDKNSLALSVKYLRGQAYGRSISFMSKLKSGEIQSTRTLLDQKMKEHITSKHKLSKSMLLDYLGSQVRAHLFS